jgi:hypothetical protein
VDEKLTFWSSCKEEKKTAVLPAVLSVPGSLNFSELSFLISRMEIIMNNDYLIGFYISQSM